MVTRCHRDRTDYRKCLVATIEKDLVDGDLILVEPGLVIPLRNGDWTLFSSCDISHLNLHYKGYRCSLVFQTDARFTTWMEDRNGWSHNVYVDDVD